MAKDMNGVTVLLQELDRELEMCSNQVPLNGHADVEIQRFLELGASVAGNLSLTLHNVLQDVGQRSAKKEPTQTEGAIEVPDVAKMLKVSKSKVQKMAALDEIPHFKLGRRILFKRSEIEKWVTAKMAGSGQK
jgi:excisionase family DNA binding protein